MPRAIGRYEILGEIGRGAMGAVYRARDPVLEREVALKTVLVGSMMEAEVKARLLREARSAARLQHPNIVTVFELGELEGTPFIAMELLEGETLAEAAAQGRLIHLDQKLRVVQQLCNALGYAHERGVIHRDVKPGNIILLGDGTVKVLDFGIARLEGSLFATRTGELLGTPAYMAPEHFTEAPIDGRVDVWSVGVILYELLSGTRPFDAGTVPALIYRIVHTPMPPLDAAAHDVPEGVVRVVSHALDKDPGRRYQDLQVMEADLAAIAGGREPKATMEGRVRVTPPRAASDAVSQPTRGVVVLPASEPLPTIRPGAYREAGVFGDGSGLSVIALSPDERVVVVGGTDGALSLWDLERRMKVETLRSRLHLRTGHAALTTSLAFSADGLMLASGHLDGAIYLWDLSTGLELEARLGHEGSIGGLIFTPDGAVLVSGGKDASIKCWEVPALLAGEARRLMRHQPAEVTSLTLAHGGRRIVAGSSNRSLRVHDTSTGRLVATLHGHRAPPSALACALDGEVVASGGRDGGIRVHRLESKEEMHVLEGHGRSVSSLAFFPDGRRLASVAMDGTLLISNLGEPGQSVTLPGGREDAFVGVAVLEGGRRLLCGLADGRIRLWELA